MPSLDFRPLVNGLRIVSASSFAINLMMFLNPVSTGLRILNVGGMIIAVGAFAISWMGPK